MLQLPNSQAQNIGSSDSGYKQPDIILLNDKQWTYVQNRYNLTPRERQIAELAILPSICVSRLVR